MTDTARLPLHRLELASGVYRITSASAIYEISVTANGLQKDGVHEVQLSDFMDAGPDTAAKPIIVEDTFYREISEEMLREIGKLARQLSISIKTPVDESAVKSVDLRKAGIDLETAKSQLQDIVAMTEKATMTIMDISDGIQDSCNTIRNNLEEITGLGFINTNDLPKPAASTGSPQSVRDTLAGIMRREEQLKRMLDAAEANLSPLSAAAAHKSVAEALKFLDTNLEVLGHEIDAVKDIYYGAGEDYSVIRRDDHDKLVRAVTSTDNVIHQIIANLNRILESLSFQDLSGQRIMRILGMLSNVQVQLLSILVSYGVRLKRRQEAKGGTPKESAEMADKEVERIKHMLTDESGEGSEWGERLDQNAIDKLLADMGF
jgi:chemotaxis regulatin CheY-phosphate phosphatase CheZ